LSRRHVSWASGEHWEPGFEALQELLAAVGIESHLEPADEHDPDALDDPPLKVLVAESEVDDARDAVEALSDADEDEPE